MNEQAVINALKLAVDCIMDAAREAGPSGAPSGVIYAALSAHGMTLNAYQQIVDSLVRHNRITIDDYHLIRIA